MSAVFDVLADTIFIVKSQKPEELKKRKAVTPVAITLLYTVYRVLLGRTLRPGQPRSFFSRSNLKMGTHTLSPCGTLHRL